jgi:hypothetical protein
MGNEAAWWQEAGIDPVKAARKLWKRTRLGEGPADSKNAKDVATPDRPSERKDVDSAPPA